LTLPFLPNAPTRAASSAASSEAAEICARRSDRREAMSLKTNSAKGNQRPAFIAGRVAPWRVWTLGLRRGRLIHQSLESNGLVDGQVGENLAVHFDACPGEPGDKPAVGEAMLAHGGVDALDPEGAEIALLFLAADIIVLQRLIDRGIGRGDVALAAAAEALGLLENLVAAGAAGNGTGWTAHGLDPPAIRHPALDAPRLGLGQRVHAAQVAGARRRIVDQPV